ncbi:hypothetical protein [Leuconostoc pseudomesenteroides]|uniref:hypothetical protein n=1 Tax=Leuconostoc pseudomesenteroides TaxID=33968 RepID=UPI001122A473|nr:hypothetical protein [Leuconostoc pseudomesenteroides]TOZ07222.1 hypothetical protein DIS14_01545 [Leuconostoc pseudomesenteroides]
MAKTLTLDVTSFKFADNETDLSFRALQNGVIVSDNTLSAVIKIKQVDVGYLKSVSAKWVDKHIVISSGDLSDLPVGSYLVELWLSSSNGYEIYPDSGFIKLYINQNATGISGNLISSITLGEFQQQFSDLGKDLMNRILDVKVGPQGEKGEKGEKGDTGPQGVQGIQGERGEQGQQGQQGIQGVAGKDFSIAKTFPSVVSMNGTGLTTGDFVMISSTVEDPDNAKLYLWNGTDFTFITDMSGATGIKGDTGEQGIQGQQGIQGEQGKQGIQGVQGETGLAGKDAVINVVTQAVYDALPDKTGVYFIGG